MDDTSSRQHKQLAAPAVEGSLATPTVVIGIDGSETGWDAFWWGCGEASRLGGRAVVVYVSPGRDVSLAAVAAVVPGVMVDYREVKRADDEMALRLAAEVDGHARARGIEACFMHVYGDPATELARVAAEVHADQIVVGRSSKARHRLAGSIGRCLVARKDAPVVVVVP